MAAFTFIALGATAVVLSLRQELDPSHTGAVRGADLGFPWYQTAARWWWTYEAIGFSLTLTLLGLLVARWVSTGRRWLRPVTAGLALLPGAMQVASFYADQAGGSRWVSSSHRVVPRDRMFADAAHVACYAGLLLPAALVLLSPRRRQPTQ